MRDANDADRRAARQHGAISHRQSRQAGLSDAKIRGRIISRRWSRSQQGVYTVAGAPATWQQKIMVACLAGPEGTVASHLSAAALFGLAVPPQVPQTILPPHANARRPGVHRSPLDRADRCIASGIPSTTPARTLIDCAAVCAFDALCHLVDTALFKELTTVWRIREAAARATGRRRPKGLRKLEEALAVWDDAIRPGSPAEARVLRWLTRNGFPPPERQYPIENEDGEVVGKGDFVWPEPMVLMEYDGEAFHGPRRWLADDRREGNVTDLGWTVVRADKDDFRPSATRLVGVLRALLIQRA